ITFTPQRFLQAGGFQAPATVEKRTAPLSISWQRRQNHRDGPRGLNRLSFHHTTL
ncbi:hypothetical protein KI387_029138, partial [Taxus chinensis]